MDKKRQSFAIDKKYGSLLSPTVLSAEGEDALEFLQGQFSQDLNKRESGRPAYGFWLNQKGKVLGDAWVRVHSPESCTIFSLGMSAEALTARLEDYLIADDVELEDQSGDWKAWWVAGDSAVEWLRQQPIDDASVACVTDQASGLGWYFAPTLPAWPEGWTEGTAEEWSRHRIALGWPEVPVDLGGDDLPQEGGMPEAAVSLNKGCYLGQEVMARISATGRVRRQLCRVGGEGAVPTGDPEELLQGDRTVGTLRSRVDHPDGGWIGLAMMSLGRWDEQGSLQLADGREVAPEASASAAD